jgi:hypothetical protein
MYKLKSYLILLCVSAVSTAAYAQEKRFILLPGSKKAYTFSSDKNGAVLLAETDINKIICTVLVDY